MSGNLELASFSRKMIGSKRNYTKISSQGRPRHICRCVCIIYVHVHMQLDTFISSRS